MHSYFRVSDPAADGGSVGDTNDNALAETDIGLDGSRRAPRPVQNQRPARMGDHETGAPMQQGPTVQGCGLYFLVKSVLCFRARSDFGVSEGCHLGLRGSAWT